MEIKEVLKKYRNYYNNMNIFLQRTSVKEIISKIRALPQREAEGLFLSLLLYSFTHDNQDEKTGFEILIKLFTEAGKDLSFIGAYNFGLRFPENKSYYVNVGPLTPQQIDEKTRIDRLVPLFSSIYKDTYRLPKLNLDLKKHIQGFVTGYDPKINRDNTRFYLIENLEGFKYEHKELTKNIQELEGDLSKLSTEKLKKLYERTLNLIKESYIKYIKTRAPNSTVDLTWKLSDLKKEFNKF